MPHRARGRLDPVNIVREEARLRFFARLSTRATANISQILDEHGSL